MPVRPKNQGYMVDFAFKGQRYREFGFTSEVEAAAWEGQARLALTKGHALSP